MTIHLYSADDAGARDPQYDLILQGLSHQIEFLRSETIKAKTTPEKALAEADREWAFVMKNYLAMLENNGLGGREDLIQAKEKMREGWKRRFSVLIDQLSKNNAVLHDYDEGPEGSVGLVVLIDAKPAYWLHRRFNRERDNY